MHVSWVLLVPVVASRIALPINETSIFICTMMANIMECYSRLPYKQGRQQQTLILFIDKLALDNDINLYFHTKTVSCHTSRPSIQRPLSASSLILQNTFGFDSGLHRVINRLLWIQKPIQPCVCRVLFNPIIMHGLRNATS